MHLKVHLEKPQQLEVILWGSVYDLCSFFLATLTSTITATKIIATGIRFNIIVPIIFLKLPLLSTSLKPLD